MKKYFTGIKQTRFILLGILLPLMTRISKAQNFKFTGGVALTKEEVNHFMMTSPDVKNYVCGSSNTFRRFNTAYTDEKPLIITLNAPVNAVTISVISLGGAAIETHTFDALGLDNEVISLPSTCDSSFVVNGNVITSKATKVSYATSIRISADKPFSQIKITKAANSEACIVVSQYQDTTPNPTCDIAFPAPILSDTLISNSCPEQLFKLQAITASNTPPSAILTWHTAMPASMSNVVTNNQILKTYYAAFYDTINQCFRKDNGTSTTALKAKLIICQ